MAFEPAEFTTAIDAVRGALDEHDGQGTVRAVYEAKYHPVFQALGFDLLGARAWRRRALVKIPAAGSVPEGLQMCLLASLSGDALNLADCLKDTHAGGIDAHIGLYTPAMGDVHHAYSNCLLTGREGEVIDDASFVVTNADRIVATLISTKARYSDDDAGASGLLSEFAVRSTSRGQGLGAALLSTALMALARNGFNDLILQHTMGNLAADRKYRRFGFRSIGDPVLTAHRPD